MAVASSACSQFAVLIDDPNGADAGMPMDAGAPVAPMDAETVIAPDAAAEPPAPDAGGPPDAGPTPAVDAGMEDTGMEDAGLPDAGVEPIVSDCQTDLSTRLAPLGVPGLSAGIVKNGRLVCTAVAGDANIRAGRPITPDTLFGWASVSKTVTAVAAMILYDDGRFDLDDDIQSHLPFTVRNPNCAGDAITFRQLLTHSSSIMDTDVYFDIYEDPNASLALRAFVEGYLVSGGAYYARDNFASSCPGRAYEYSNVGVALLGSLVEQISGVPFDDFCQDRIFAPLGMNASSFRLGPLEVDQVAVAYEGNSELPHLDAFPDGSGSLRTSVPQLARFLAMMTSGGAYGGQRILEASTVEEMFRLQIPALEQIQGLLWFHHDIGNHSGLVGHDGSDPGLASLMFFDPSDGAGVLLVGNADWFERRSTETAANALFSDLLDEAAAY